MRGLDFSDKAIGELSIRDWSAAGFHCSGDWPDRQILHNERHQPFTCPRCRRVFESRHQLTSCFDHRGKTPLM